MVSGRPIPDDRLEAAAAEPGPLEEGDDEPAPEPIQGIHIEPHSQAR